MYCIGVRDAGDARHAAQIVIIGYCLEVDAGDHIGC